MMWLIPRSDQGALTEYRRPHAGGVSTERGALLPYGPFPRLIMLWMYAECAHAAQIPPEQRNPVSSISDFLVAIGIDTMEVSLLFEQADRLFACRFDARDKVIPVIEPSFTRRVEAADHRGDVASLRGTGMAYSDTFARELSARRLKPCMHGLRALRHCPFLLDVYLWDACHGARALPGTAPPRSRLACYRALADHPSRDPSVGDVLAFEADLAQAREELRRLEEEAASADERTRPC